MAFCKVETHMLLWWYQNDKPSPSAASQAIGVFLIISCYNSCFLMWVSILTVSQTCGKEAVQPVFISSPRHCHIVQVSGQVWPDFHLLVGFYFGTLLYVPPLNYFSSHSPKLLLLLLVRKSSSPSPWGCNNQVEVKVKVLLTQSCPTLCDPMDYSPPGSSVHRIFQARILECIAISFYTESSWPRDGTWVSCIAGRFFIVLSHLPEQ